MDRDGESEIRPAVKAIPDERRAARDGGRSSPHRVTLQMLHPGQQTRFHRHTGTVLYHTVRGRGATIIDRSDSKEMQWAEHDSFSLPSWRWHAHRNVSETEPAILFSVTDRPLLEMTGLDREELG